jgi:hypothetical protein
VIDPQDLPEDLLEALKEMHPPHRGDEAHYDDVLELLMRYGPIDVLEALADEFKCRSDQAREPLDEGEAENLEAAANWDLASEKIRDALRFASAAIEHENRARRENTSG